MHPKLKAAMELKEATTPREVVEQFRAALKYNDVPAALNMIDEIDYGSPAAASVRQRFEKMGVDMSRGGTDFKILEAKQESDCAAVIVQQNPQRAGPAQLQAVFLIQRQAGWKVSPEVNGFASIRRISAAQQSSFQTLDTWFRSRKAEWKVMLDDPR